MYMDKQLVVDDDQEVCQQLKWGLTDIEGENSLAIEDAVEDYSEQWGMVGSCPAMQSVFSTIRKVAASRVPVLITGENGTGKGLVASAIHAAGPRRNGPLVVLNCSAIPENLLER